MRFRNMDAVFGSGHSHEYVSAVVCVNCAAWRHPVAAEAREMEIQADAVAPDVPAYAEDGPSSMRAPGKGSREM